MASKADRNARLGAAWADFSDAVNDVQTARWESDQDWRDARDRLQEKEEAYLAVAREPIEADSDTAAPERSASDLNVDGEWSYTVPESGADAQPRPSAEPDRADAPKEEITDPAALRWLEFDRAVEEQLSAYGKSDEEWEAAAAKVAELSAQWEADASDGRTDAEVGDAGGTGSPRTEYEDVSLDHDDAEFDDPEPDASAEVDDPDRSP